MATEKIANIMEEIKTLTILELKDLVKALEEEFGVSAAPVAASTLKVRTPAMRRGRYSATQARRLSMLLSQTAATVTRLKPKVRVMLSSAPSRSQPSSSGSTYTVLCTPRTAKLP